MVGYTDEGRLVTCMELYYSEPLKCGAVQIRAPPTNIKGFVADFAAWFANSGKLIRIDVTRQRRSPVTTFSTRVFELNRFFRFRETCRHCRRPVQLPT